ncbi:MAG: hypothetical protein Q9213_002426 [Squamulea squamosa]
MSWVPRYDTVPELHDANQEVLPNRHNNVTLSGPCNTSLAIQNPDQTMWDQDQYALYGGYLNNHVKSFPVLDQTDETLLQGSRQAEHDDSAHLNQSGQAGFLIDTRGSYCPVLSSPAERLQWPLPVQGDDRVITNSDAMIDLEMLVKSQDLFKFGSTHRPQEHMMNAQRTWIDGHNYHWTDSILENLDNGEILEGSMFLECPQPRLHG